MANVKRLKEILAIIENEPGSVNMNNWDSGLLMNSYVMRNSKCDSVRCVAGWAWWLYDRDTYPQTKYTTNGSVENEYHLNGMKLLNLTEKEADELFYCDNEDVVEVLEDLIQQYS